MLKTYRVSPQLTILPRFQWGGTPSRIGLQREYASYENGLFYWQEQQYTNNTKNEACL